MWRTLRELGFRTGLPLGSFLCLMLKEFQLRYLVSEDAMACLISKQQTI